MGEPRPPAHQQQPAALIATLSNAVEALGRGFDVTVDNRLLYCKGVPESRLVWLDDVRPWDFAVADVGSVLSGVPASVDIVRGRPRRETAPVCSFREMALYFNKRSGLTENVALGSFNSMFSLTGCSKVDAAATKTLAMVGYYIPLFKAKLTNAELVLQEEVKLAVPRSWDPPSLASFIENFGTHIITSVTIGGRDEIYIKQHQSSSLSASDIEKYVKDIGDQRFLSLENQFGVLSLLSSQDAQNLPSNIPHISGKEDVTVIFRRRGGDELVQNHVDWAKTVSSAPDVINMTFVPIVALLDGLPGTSFLARAINLYLEFKPPIEELQYFLDFQIERVWSPAQTSIPGHQRKEPVCPSLQFSLMGPKLYVSSDQISVGRRPVTGLRLCLEGSKQNRLSIHLQHLASLPKILLPHWDSHISIGPPKWKGPEEQDSRWFEPIKWKNFAHVSTAPIEHTDTTIGDLSGVFIVTGAQLGVWDFGAKSVLHLKLLFSRVPGCTIRRSVWDHSPNPLTGAAIPHGLDDPSSSSSTEQTSQVKKLAKIVDSSEMLKGPQDSPGHWLVTGAKLGVEKGRIIVRVKYSLLNY
ncbi:MACPF domain-containing protein CAD1 [Apostasia shenzhenica]|uniref:MACPF domain-containing protein CAD1 n=1 Tax=Apostasia shenzhenica TaxID=1088818 RepID=A0A2I0B9Z8_9ASPA|nr:MACPF domain-containing protein CAD1 [Apostasia shenzhenica]